MAKFKRLTPAQESTYAALRALRSMVVSPQDARPLKALVRRGLVRYRRIEGVRYAELRATRAQTAQERREAAWLKRYERWIETTRSAKP